MESDWKKYKAFGEQAELEQRYDIAEAMWSMAALLAEHNSNLYLAFSLDRLSNALLKQQKSDLAQYFLRRAWHIKTKVLNSPALDRAVTLNLMAEQCFKTKKLPEAEQLLKQVFDIYLASFGSGDRRTAAAAGNLDILKKLNAERAAATQQQSATTSPAGGPPAGHSGAPMDPQPAIAAPKAAMAPPAREQQTNSGVQQTVRTTPDHVSRPKCDRCGADLTGEDCLRCTGTSIKAISPLDRLV